MVQQTMNPFRIWAIDQHKNTNHLYDKIIPYEYHLHMVAREVVRHIVHRPIESTNEQCGTLIDAAYGHDLIEDCRITYNDLLENGASREVAEIIYALTDEKGKNRVERGRQEHYSKLIQVPGAAYVKFCDRIANVRYSKFAESSMYDKYKREHGEFIRKCYIPELEQYKLVETLEELFR
jgi:hypothetical protein